MSTLLRHYVALSAALSDLRALVTEETYAIATNRDAATMAGELRAYTVALEGVDGLAPEMRRLMTEQGLSEYVPEILEDEPSMEGVLSGFKALIEKLRGSAPKPSHRLQDMDLAGAQAVARQVDQAFQQAISATADEYPANYTHRPDMEDETVEYGVPLNVLLTALNSFKAMPAMTNKVLDQPIPKTPMEFDRYVKTIRPVLAPLKAVWNEELNDEGLLVPAHTDLIKSRRTTASAKVLGFHNEAAFRRLFGALRETAMVSGANILANAERKFVELRKLHSEQNKVGGDKEQLATLERYAESVYAIALTMVLGYMEHRYTVANVFLQMMHATHQAKK